MVPIFQLLPSRALSRDAHVYTTPGEGRKSLGFLPVLLYSHLSRMRSGKLKAWELR